jgi:hypothetical protein
MARHIESSSTGNRKETKAQNLVPQRMDGLYGSRENVFDKLSGLSTDVLPGHNLIVASRVSDLHNPGFGPLFTCAGTTEVSLRLVRAREIPCAKH